eukprot:TRINITY_DN22740_c0_g1_i2.p1 TRINITY_DN22740_c0_g1~~TRINITY_DN22740_c0_g1_i2.p1  ORF type:complete len:711 (-),score=98.19 TRINITY_DN22740_c0_g1_i2:22-2154(-)
MAPSMISVWSPGGRGVVSSTTCLVVPASNSVCKVVVQSMSAAPRYSDASCLAAVGTASTRSIYYTPSSRVKDEEEELNIFLRHEDWNVATAHQRRIQAFWSSRSQLQLDQNCRGFCFRIAENRRFAQLFYVITAVAVVIAILQLNAALSIQMATGHPDPYLDTEALGVLSLTVTCCFAVEVTIRIIGSPVSILRDGWLLTDTIVTVVAAIDDCFTLGTTGSSSGGSVAVARAIKIIRIFRAAKAISLVRRIPSLVIASSYMTENLIQALWLIVVFGVISWCVAILTTIAGGSGLAGTLDEFEVVVDDHSFSIRPLLGSMFGSLLFISMIPWRGLRWGPGAVRPLLAAESASLNVLGLFWLTYITICLTLLVQLTVSVFTVAMSIASKKDSDRRVAQQQFDHKLKIRDLCRIFKEGIGSNREGIMSMNNFKQVMKKEKSLAEALLVGSDQPGHAEAVFHELDRGSEVGVPASSMTMSEFVLGIVKLTRVGPQPEFLHIDEQQLHLLQLGKQVLDSYHSLMLTSFRYVRTLAKDMKQVNGCVDIMREKINKDCCSPRRIAIHRQPWLTQSKLGQQLSSFRMRLDRAELKLDEFKVHQGIKGETQHVIAKLTDSILEEDVLPWLRQNIPRKAPSNQSYTTARRKVLPRPKTSALPPHARFTSTQQGSVLGKPQLPTSQTQFAASGVQERTAMPDTLEADFAKTFVPATPVSHL